MSPLLTFNPAFTLLVAWFVLRERPGLVQTLGVILVLFGAYLTEVEQARAGLLTPIRVLLNHPRIGLAVLASALWGITTVLEKLSIDRMYPSNGLVVALLGTVLMVLFLTLEVFRTMREKEEVVGTQNKGKGLFVHPRALLLAILIAGIAPLFGFTTIALGLVGYVTTLFKLSAVLTILWARLFLSEGNIRNRLLGTSVMIVGGVLVAV